MNSILKDAQKNKYGVGLFNVIDTDGLQAAIAAAEELRSPIIIGTAEVLLPYGDLHIIGPGMIEMAKREIRFYKHYFNEFYVAQSEKVRRKIAQTLIWLQTLDRLPCSILRSIEGKKGLFEIRIEFGGNIFRVFCCFDEGSLVILFNGFQKKCQRTPPGEIEKADKLMKEYFTNKK